MNGDPEFQVAPMVDVLLVLLVFFMAITSAQVLKVDKTIKLPVAVNGLKKENSRTEIVVNVRWDDKKKTANFIMNDRVYASIDQLTADLGAAKLNARRPPVDPKLAPRLVIRADRDAELGFISQLMNAGAAAGISDISFSSVNKE